MKSLRPILAALACSTLLLTACGPNDQERESPPKADPRLQAVENVPKHPEPGALPDYIGPENYQFVYSASCFCPVRGLIRVSVQNGEAVSAEYVKKDGSPRRGEGTVPEYSYVSIQDIIDEANAAEALTVDWPSGQGWPDSVSIDRMVNAVDDEIGYTIEGVYSAGSGIIID